MDKNEAERLLLEQVDRLESLSQREIIAEVGLEEPETLEIYGPSGAWYQVEIEAFWDKRSHTDLRVSVSIDDGGWRAFFPLAYGFTVKAANR